MRHLTKMCGKHPSFVFTKDFFFDLLAAVLAGIPVLVLHIIAQPPLLGFFCDDDSLKYPYKADTVTDQALLLAILGIPLILLFVMELFALLKAISVWGMTETKREGRAFASLYFVVRMYMIYFQGFLFVNLLTLTFKYTTGRLRPNFLDVCKPDVDLTSCTGYVTNYVCTNKNITQNALRSARLSFPSGHGAMSLFCALFLMLYIEFRFQARHSRMLRVTFQTGLLLAAFWCCATRITDHKHHASDVIGGGLLGVAVAIPLFFRVALHSLKELNPDLKADGCSHNKAHVDIEQGEPQTPTPLLVNHDSLGKTKNAYEITRNGVHIGPMLGFSGEKSEN